MYTDPNIAERKIPLCPYTKPIEQSPNEAIMGLKIKEEVLKQLDGRFMKVAHYP